ncbi:MAG TPA: hypothetical protein VFP12_03500 [Allosphingosinicella sp.]|nr:hypothetical protein [Allosphingosinicella sp.]
MQEPADQQPETEDQPKGAARPTGPVKTTQPMRRITLGKRLEDTNRHPVLIFGTAAAGKSSLILSLINALGNAEEVNVVFADNEPIFDDSYGDFQKQRHAIARQFYDWGIHRWTAGQPPLPNIGERFFIPVDIQPRNSLLPPVKFAILDGRGEDYGPNTQLDAEQGMVGDIRRPLGEEIKQLLQEFSHEITVIYVAPFSQHGAASEDTIDGNTGLRHVIQEYSAARVQDLRANDSHLFLFTKWDEHAHPLMKRDLFAEPTSIDVAKQLRIRYESAWGQFCGLPVGGPARDRRVFMQYSAGYFVNERLHPPPDLVEETFRRYPRTIANWLYSRAARSSLRRRQLNADLPQDIFEDVRLEHATKSLADRLIDLILGNSPQ